jgi:hypothetical protein
MPFPERCYGVSAGPGGYRSGEYRFMGLPLVIQVLAIVVPMML